MRTILSPEQVAAVVADIAVWIDGHVARLPGVYPDDSAKVQAEQQSWRDAILLSVEQLAEIDELECYHISLHFTDGPGYVVNYVLKREANGCLNRLNSFTFFPPEYTHPTQLN